MRRLQPSFLSKYNLLGSPLEINFLFSVSLLNVKSGPDWAGLLFEECDESVFFFPPDSIEVPASMQVHGWHERSQFFRHDGCGGMDVCDVRWR